MIFLKQNDSIDIIAPAASSKPEVLIQGRAALAAWKLDCHIPKRIFGKDIFSANNIKQRSKQLIAAILNNQSKAIWCLRGGYGSAKLIPFLENITPPTHQKIFIGFSDITALHLFLQLKWGWSTIHGPSWRQFALHEVSKQSLLLMKKIIFGSCDKIIYNNLYPLNKLACKEEIINAKIIGGNLTLIQDSLATSWQIDATNKILLVEDIHEKAYRIDRMLEQLKQAKILTAIKAILLGDFTDVDEPRGKSLLKETINDFAKNCQYPVFRIKNVGHGFINYPIPLGTISYLYAGKKTRLVIPLR